MTDTDRAYEALGKTRSELARYKEAHGKQQRRIRELEKDIRTKNARIAELEEQLSLLSDFLEGMADASPKAVKDFLTVMVNQIRDLLNKKG